MPQPASTILRVTDSAGRVLGLRLPGVLQRLLLLEAIGPENARNAAYMGIAGLAAALVEIDGAAAPPIATKRQLEQRVQHLDEHGLAAAGRALAARTADAETPASPRERAKARLEDAELMTRLSLVQAGIPFRDAFDLAPDEPFPLDESWVLTLHIGFGTLRGGTYDWKANRWRRR